MRIVLTIPAETGSPRGFSADSGPECPHLWARTGPAGDKNRPYFLASGWNPAIYRGISHGSMALKGRPVAAGP